MTKKIYIAFCLLGLSSCKPLPPEAYANRGEPEQLLSVSSEFVSIDLDSKASLDKLSSALSKDPPDHIVLNCSADEKLCKSAKAIVGKFKIDTKEAQNTNSGSNVTLIYDEILARDCEQRYIDNSINNYNLEPPTYGCSQQANIVQMISDRKQITNPGLLDYSDGSKPELNYVNQYINPPAAVQPTSSTSSLIGGSSSSQ